MNPYRSIMLGAALFCCLFASAQRAVNSIVTNSTTLSPTSVSVKGAGLTNASGVRSSLWDSTGTSFTVNYSNGTNNVTAITQMTVAGKANPYTTIGVESDIRVRRSNSPYVGSNRMHYNYWAAYNSIPANNATSGIFNIRAPMPISDQGIMTNNLNLGFDNIFQNTINSLHAGNIERVDFVLRTGLRPNAFDVDNAGMVVFDRGAGDTFKIAAILTVDGSGNPTSYGPLRSVSSSHYGPNLLPSAMNICIFTADENFGTLARPSSQQAQNIRGVLLTLGDLGVSAGQTFYGYSLFGYDVVTADPNWLTYPNNTNTLNQLDPVGVFMLFKDVNSVLAVPADLKLSRNNGKPFLRYTVKDAGPQIIYIERSFDGQNFAAIEREEVPGVGEYVFTDHSAPSGTVYYRVQIVSPDGSSSFSPVRSLNAEGLEFSVFPNPASDFISIKGSGLSGLKASLVSLSGQVVLSVMMHSDNERVPLLNIPSGVYILQLGNERRKIVVR